MDADAYATLVEAVNAVPVSACPHFRSLSKVFGVPEDTVKSIYGQEWQYRIKSQHSVLLAKISGISNQFRSGESGECCPGALIRDYFQPRTSRATLVGFLLDLSIPLAGTSLLELAYATNTPPCTLARRALESLELGLTRPQIGQILRAPDHLSTLIRESETERKDARLVPRLVCDVADCVVADQEAGPASDAARAASGSHHEQRLYSMLNGAGIAYWTEDVLRSRGFFKTPDALLQVPIVVWGTVVHWIDSKATFGDPHMHRYE